jgi:hypothetical protein
MISSAASFLRRGGASVNVSRVAAPAMGAVRNLNVHGEEEELLFGSFSIDMIMMNDV